MFSSKYIQSAIFALGIGLTHASLAEPFEVLSVEGPTHIAPFNSYDVKVNFTETTSEDDFNPFAYVLVSLKDPTNDWTAYGKTRRIVRTGEGFTSDTITVDFDAIPSCSECVWEARALTSIDAAEESTIDIDWQWNISINQSDEVADVRLEATAVAPGGYLELELDYSADGARDIRVEMISQNSDNYSSVIQQVSAGAGSLNIILPLASGLEDSDAPFVSVKINPAGSHWSQYFDEVNQDVNVVSLGGDYYWPFDIENIAFTRLYGPSPSAGSRYGKVGLINEGPFADDSLPFYGVTGILFYAGSGGPSSTGYVLDLNTGDILFFQSNPSFPIDHPDYWQATVISLDTPEAYEDALDRMINLANRLTNGWGSPFSDSFPEFQASADYLNAIKTQF